jgi:hypothetical protein
MSKPDELDPRDCDYVLCVCCEEEQATGFSHALGGPVGPVCEIMLRNAQDALRETPGIGGWSDICRENGNITGVDL